MFYICHLNVSYAALKPDRIGQLNYAREPAQVNKYIGCYMVALF